MNRIAKWSVRTALVLATAAPATLYAASNQPIGRVTAAFGSGSIFAEEQARPADLHALVNNNELITTGQGGLSILLASRIVLKIDSHSAVRIWEGTGQTNIQVDYGTAHVFVGRRAVTNGVVQVHDGNAVIEATTAVFLVSYDPDSRKSYYACEENSVLVRPRRDGIQAFTLASNQQAQLAADQPAAQVAAISAHDFQLHKQNLERLGQVATQQGGQVFRLRSRTQDLQSAINALSAQGWIDANTLAANLRGKTELTASGLSSSAATGQTASDISSAQPRTDSDKSSAAPNLSVVSPVASVDSSTSVEVGLTGTSANNSLELPTQASLDLPVSQPPAVAGLDVAADTAATNSEIDRQPAVEIQPSVASIAPPVDAATLPPVTDIGLAAGAQIPVEIPTVATLETSAAPAVDVPPAAVAAVAVNPEIEAPVASAGRHPHRPSDAGLPLAVKPVETITMPVETVVLPPPVDLGLDASTAVAPILASVAPVKIEPAVQPVVPPAAVAPPVEITPPVTVAAPTQTVVPPAAVTPPVDVVPPVTVTPPPTDIGVTPPPVVAPPVVAPPTTPPVSVVPPPVVEVPPVDTIVPPVTPPVTTPDVTPPPTDVIK